MEENLELTEKIYKASIKEVWLGDKLLHIEINGKRVDSDNFYQCGGDYE